MSSDTRMRTRVLRGPAAAGIRGVALDADLNLLRPLAPLSPAASVDAEAMAQQLRAEASRVGYEDGFTAGQAAGLEEGRAQAQAGMQRLESALHAVDAAARTLATRQAGAVADVEQHIATLATAIAEAVLRRELATVDAPARDALVRALQLAPKTVDVIARVHPDDVDTIGDLSCLTAERGVMIVGDAAVEPGGCVLDAGLCSIDAQISTALDRVRQELGA